ncbi:MAG: hypothetical protein IJH39_02520 [Clostridia bacterium]|nr:hypothetical protein [Clostridia bacterium]
MKRRYENTGECSIRYKTLFIKANQVRSNHIRISQYTTLNTGEYKFNDIRFYTEHNFCGYDLFDKYYEKLDLRTFDDVLDFLVKLGWEIYTIVPASYDSNHDVDTYLYTFVKEI